MAIRVEKASKGKKILICIAALTVGFAIPLCKGNSAMGSLVIGALAAVIVGFLMWIDTNSKDNKVYMPKTKGGKIVCKFVAEADIIEVAQDVMEGQKRIIYALNFLVDENKKEGFIIFGLFAVVNENGSVTWMLNLRAQEYGIAQIHKGALLLFRIFDDKSLTEEVVELRQSLNEDLATEKITEQVPNGFVTYTAQLGLYYIEQEKLDLLCEKETVKIRIDNSGEPVDLDGKVCPIRNYLRRSREVIEATMKEEPPKEKSPYEGF